MLDLSLFVSDHFLSPEVLLNLLKAWLAEQSSDLQQALCPTQQNLFEPLKKEIEKSSIKPQTALSLVADLENARIEWVKRNNTASQKADYGKISFITINLILGATFNHCETENKIKIFDLVFGILTSIGTLPSVEILKEDILLNNLVISMLAILGPVCEEITLIASEKKWDELYRIFSSSMKKDETQTPSNLLDKFIQLAGMVELKLLKPLLKRYRAAQKELLDHSIQRIENNTKRKKSISKRKEVEKGAGTAVAVNSSVPENAHSLSVIPKSSTLQHHDDRQDEHQRKKVNNKHNSSYSTTLANLARASGPQACQTNPAPPLVVSAQTTVTIFPSTSAYSEYKNIFGEIYSYTGFDYFFGAVAAVKNKLWKYHEHAILKDFEALVVDLVISIPFALPVNNDYFNNEESLKALLKDNKEYMILFHEMAQLLADVLCASDNPSHFYRISDQLHQAIQTFTTYIPNSIENYLKFASRISDLVNNLISGTESYNLLSDLHKHASELVRICRNISVSLHNCQDKLGFPYNTVFLQSLDELVTLFQDAEKNAQREIQEGISIYTELGLIFANLSEAHTPSSALSSLLQFNM